MAASNDFRLDRFPFMTVRVEASFKNDPETSGGTAFWYHLEGKASPVLVTNRHVLFSKNKENDWVLKDTGTFFFHGTQNLSQFQETTSPEPPAAPPGAFQGNSLENLSDRQAAGLRNLHEARQREHDEEVARHTTFMMERRRCRYTMEIDLWVWLNEDLLVPHWDYDVDLCVIFFPDRELEAIKDKCKLRRPFKIDTGFLNDKFEPEGQALEALEDDQQLFIDRGGYEAVKLAKMCLSSDMFTPGPEPTTPVFMVGYPRRLHDDRHNMPLFQQGVVASHGSYDHCGEQEGVCAIEAWPGSSGSPMIAKLPGGGYAFIGVFFASPGYGPDNIPIPIAYYIKKSVLDAWLQEVDLPDRFAPAPAPMPDDDPAAEPGIDAALLPEDEDPGAEALASLLGGDSELAQMAQNDENREKAEKSGLV